MKNKVEGNMQQAIASDVECELVAYVSQNNTYRWASCCLMLVPSSIMILWTNQQILKLVVRYQSSYMMFLHV